MDLSSEHEVQLSIQESGASLIEAEIFTSSDLIAENIAQANSSVLAAIQDALEHQINTD